MIARIARKRAIGQNDKEQDLLESLKDMEGVF